jgi:hypothetical protein
VAEWLRHLGEREVPAAGLDPQLAIMRSAPAMSTGKPGDRIKKFHAGVLNLEQLVNI